jgi:hypothetical protein
VGWTSKLSPPKYPKDDSNVSTRATPESKGARPCKHCGSSKHWECKHARSAARTRLAHTSIEDDNANVAYEDLYLEAIHESEHEFDPNPTHVNSVNTETEKETEEPLSDFQHTPQTLEAHCELAKQVSPSENVSTLGGSNDSTSNPSSDSGESNLMTRQERRRFRKDTKHVLAYLQNLNLKSWAPNSLIKLKRFMSRPAGCAFLGSSASTTNVWLGE